MHLSIHVRELWESLLIHTSHQPFNSIPQKKKNIWQKKACSSILFDAWCKQFFKQIINFSRMMHGVAYIWRRDKESIFFFYCLVPAQWCRQNHTVYTSSYVLVLSVYGVPSIQKLLFMWHNTCPHDWISNICICFALLLFHLQFFVALLMFSPFLFIVLLAFDSRTLISAWKISKVLNLKNQSEIVKRHLFISLFLQFLVNSVLDILCM